MSRLLINTALTLGMLLTAGLTASATIIRVPEDQPSIAEAISVAYPGDVILVQPEEFEYTLLIDYAGKAIQIEQDTEHDSLLLQPEDALYLMAADSELVCANYGTIRLYGEVRSPALGTASLISRYVQFESGSAITVLPGGRLDLVANGVSINGNINVGTNGTLWLSANGPWISGNTILLDDAHLGIVGAIEFDGTLNALGATITASDSMGIGDWLFMNGGRIVCGEDIYISSHGIVTLYGTELTMSGTANITGELKIYDGLVFAETIDVGTYNAFDPQRLVLDNTALYTVLLNVDDYGTLRGSGAWYTDLTNAGNIEITADTTIDGDVTNEETGVINIYAGTLHFAGTLTNDGTIIGDYTGPPGRDDDIRTVHISGDYAAGEYAGLFIPGTTLRIDGQCDIAITDSTRFDLNTATLTLGTLTGSQTSFELMGADYGPDPIGLTPDLPGNFPIDTLHIAGGTISLVDLHDNDLLGQETPEALYVNTLRIDTGATLQNAGFNIYYRTLINDGVITDPANVTPLPEYTVGDMNCDNFVNFDDINGFVLAIVGPEAYQAEYPACRWLNADCNGDALVTFDDIHGFVNLLAGK